MVGRNKAADENFVVFRVVRHTTTHPTNDSPLHSHVPQNAVARSASLLPHHNALAAVGEGNEGNRAAESLLFFFFGKARERGIYSIR